LPGSRPGSRTCCGHWSRGPPRIPIETREHQTTGTITGRVSFAGTVPPATKRKLIEDPACAAMHKDGLEIQKLLVKDGKVAAPSRPS
jgi:hypothetical protein